MNAIFQSNNDNHSENTNNDNQSNNDNLIQYNNNDTYSLNSSENDTKLHIELNTNVIKEKENEIQNGILL